MIKLALILIITLLFITSYASCNLGEFKVRGNALRTLVSENAKTNMVERVLHSKFEYLEKGSPGWKQMFERYSGGSRSDKSVALKMEQSSVVGITSTQTMLTYIFVNDNGEVFDFVVTAQ